jgi:hypothetical protein
LRLSLVPIAQGLAQPLFVTHAGDASSRLFIVEKPGTIRIQAADRVLERPFLDIRDLVGSNGSEQGLLGLAFPSGRIWALVKGDDGWRSLEMLDTDLSLSSFGEGEDGELYVTDLNRGRVYQIR